jgi:RHS repeat-associated protein
LVRNFLTRPFWPASSIVSVPPYGTIVAQTETTPKTNLFRFASGLYSSTLGLHKFGMRWYDQKLQRWTQPDQIDQAGDLREGNRYGYVGGNPVNRLDPSGMAGQCQGPPGHRPRSCGQPGAGGPLTRCFLYGGGALIASRGSLLAAGVGCATGVIGRYVRN